MRVAFPIQAVAIAAIAAGVAMLVCQLQPRALFSNQRDPGTERGPIDIGFAQFMSLHHAQAIAMAQLMLDGRPTPLANLARNLANAQLLELGEMRGWLRLWRQPLLPVNRRDMGWMLLGSSPPDAGLQQYLLDCEQSPTGMAGLASDDELNRLRLLDGRARDAHFLGLMLAHHEGGIPMARFAAAQALLPVVRDLAERIALEQSQEIIRLAMTLDALVATAGHAPEDAASRDQSGQAPLVRRME